MWQKFLNSRYRDFIPEAAADTDYQFGQEHGLPQIQIDGWMRYAPSHERQKRFSLETYACGPFTAANILETILNYYLQNQLFTGDDERWLIDRGYVKNGSIELSDRFIAYNSNITRGVGTSFKKVGDAVRHYGLIPEEMWPYPQDGKWRTYFQEPLQECFDLGAEFLKRFEPIYKVVYENDFDRALLQSPLQVIVYAWKYKKEYYYNPTGKYNHFTALMENLGNHDLVFDTYQPFIKKLAPDYDYFYYGYMWGIKIKQKDHMKLIQLKGQPEIYTVTESGKRLHILNMEQLREGERNGLWRIQDKREVEEDEFNKYSEGRPFAFII